MKPYLKMIPYLRRLYKNVEVGESQYAVTEQLKNQCIDKKLEMDKKSQIHLKMKS